MGSLEAAVISSYDEYMLCLHHRVEGKCKKVRVSGSEERERYTRTHNDKHVTYSFSLYRSSPTIGSDFSLACTLI